MLDRVDYMGVRKLASAHPGLIILVSNVSPISVDEAVYGNDLTEKCRRQKWRPEEKIVALMKSLVQKFWKPGNLVLDEFAGTHSTAKSVLLLYKHG